MQMLSKLAKKEEDLWETIIERSARDNPEWFWNDGNERGPRKGLASWILDKWPTKLTFGYLFYLIDNLEGKGRYNSSDTYERWVNLPVWGEWRYLGRTYNDNRFSLKWAWIQLTDETKGQRLICRIKGHPKGEIYYNPGGFEPDHRCQTCGEEIG